jgi:hypothetical protein
MSIRTGGHADLKDDLGFEERRFADAVGRCAEGGQGTVDAPGVLRGAVDPQVDVAGRAWACVRRHCEGSDDEILNAGVVERE